MNLKMIRPLRLFGTAMVCLVLSACVLQPYNDQVLESRNSAVLFQGSTVVPDDLVELQYLSSSSGQFETFATTRTITDPVVVGGTTHFLWSITVNVPTDAWRYAGYDWEAEIRVYWPVAGVGLPTVEAGAVACYEEYDFDYFDFANHCASPESPLITLKTPYY